jgi:hypothetical protein
MTLHWLLARTQLKWATQEMQTAKTASNNVFHDIFQDRTMFVMIFMVVHSSLSLYLFELFLKNTHTHIHIYIYILITIEYYRHCDMYPCTSMCTTKTHKSQKHIDHKSMILWSWDQNLIESHLSNWFQLDQLVPGQHNWFPLVPVGSTVGSRWFGGVGLGWPGTMCRSPEILLGILELSGAPWSPVEISWIYAGYMSYICHIYIIL